MPEETTTVTTGGRAYTLTPMTVAEHTRLKLRHIEFAKLKREGRITPLCRADLDFCSAVFATIHASIQRADPTVTLDQLESDLSIRDAEILLTTLRDISILANCMDPRRPIQ